MGLNIKTDRGWCQKSPGAGRNTFRSTTTRGPWDDSKNKEEETGASGECSSFIVIVRGPCTRAFIARTVARRNTRVGNKHAA